MTRLLWLWILPFLGAVAAPWITRRWPRAAGPILALIPTGLLAALTASLPISTPLEVVLPWVPSFGVTFAFRLDGLGALFGMLICLIGAFVILHAGGYLAGDPRKGSLLGQLLAFLGSMLGLVLADDLITLIVFWELTSLLSFSMIAFDREKAKARKAARTALLVTGFGGLLLIVGLLGLGLAGRASGLADGEWLRLSALLVLDWSERPLPVVPIVLIVLGAVTKSAQVPFHFWLPRAMAGPTPVSAFLHSATMVKAGVYLLARFFPAFGGEPLWQGLLIGFGAPTLLFGGLLALIQRDLKSILAYSTVAVLGTLVMLLGSGTFSAVKAAIVFLTAHALYKAALFLVAGNVDHETGTRDLARLSGLRRAMPWTAAAGIVAALSQAGAPPMFGFIGKELSYEAKLDAGPHGDVLLIVAVAGNILLTAAALIAGVRPFVGRRKRTPRAPHEAHWSMVVGPLGLAALGLFVGIVPSAFDDYLGTPAATAISGRLVTMDLKLWHGLNPEALAVLTLSAITLGCGWLLFRQRQELQRRLARGLRYVVRLGPDALFDRGYDGILSLSRRGALAIQGAGLRRHLIIVLATWVLLTAYPAWRAVVPHLDLSLPSLPLFEVSLVVLSAAGAIVAARARERLAAVAALAATGLPIALLFLVFGAPDLALTLLVVEILSVALFVVVFYRLMRPVRPEPSSRRRRDALLAGAAGLVMTSLILATASVDLPADVSAEISARSVPEAKGRNVVNVILVDFRSLDTLGETIVVALAGVGVVALWKLRRAPLEDPP